MRVCKGMPALQVRPVLAAQRALPALQAPLVRQGPRGLLALLALLGPPVPPRLDLQGRSALPVLPGLPRGPQAHPAGLRGHKELRGQRELGA
jgi:hypothetical protein